jgi:hypothetical protein
MPRYILLEEFHLSVAVPSTVADNKRESIRRILNSSRFRMKLRKAIVQHVRKNSALRLVRMTISV